MQERKQITNEELQAINRFTLKEVSDSDVAVFTMKIIDDEPTSNGRIWTKEWQREAVARNLFDGVPFLTNHENDQETKIGTIFSADFREDGTYGKVYIPLDDKGKQDVEAIENGRIKNVSINGHGEAKEINDHLHITPSDDMRVFEVSSVAVGGCRTCKITETHKPCESKNTETDGNGGQTSQTPKYTEQMNDLLSVYTTQLKESFVRLAGFTFPSRDKQLYEAIADNLNPVLLKQLTDEMQQACDSKIEQDKPDGVSPVTDIQNEVERIMKAKGVL